MSAKRRANVGTYSLTSDDEDDSCSNDARDANLNKASRAHPAELSRNHEKVVIRGKSSKQRPCLNRNALMARENRQRKKEYVERIENKLSFYKEENKNLSNTIQRQNIDLKRLRSEVSYLRNVLNNSGSITNLLRSMNENLSAGKRRNGEKDDEMWRKKSYVGDSDHTYTNSSTDGSVQDRCSLSSVDKNDTDGKPSLCVVGNVDLLSSGHEESPFGIVDDDITDHRLDQFDFVLDSPPSAIFNNNRDDNDFNEIGGIDSVDFTTTKLFDNLDNSGVCLHVNSGKISLEFCSICHLNSVNSSE